MRLLISKYYYLHPILHRFQDMADYLSIFGDYGVPLFNTLVRGKIPEFRIVSSSLKKVQTSLYYSEFRYVERFRRDSRV